MFVQEEQAQSAVQRTALRLCGSNSKDYNCTSQIENFATDMCQICDDSDTTQIWPRCCSGGTTQCNYTNTINCTSGEIMQAPSNGVDSCGGCTAIGIFKDGNAKCGGNINSAKGTEC